MKQLSAIVIAAIGLGLAACGTTTGVTASPAPDGTESAGGTGPTIVTGNVTYTNPFFVEGVAQPVIILEDQGGFVVRDRKFLIPVESQVIGQITSDFFTSPFTYSITLPETPRGTLRDVDHDGSDDKGVMVFAVAYWTNTWGDPFLERRDQGGGGWSTAYASTNVSDNRDSYLEVTGGKYLVYAPDGDQQFPSGFGDDKKLFTDDDPLMALAAGWSTIDLDADPFTVDRSASPTIDLIEPESTALDDYSSLGYAAAFDKLLEKFKNEYAFTELKKIDWDAKGKEFRPRFEEAEAKGDASLYALALRDFIWSIPDSHVGIAQTADLNAQFTAETAGGLGFAMRETDDGKFIANFILTDGPADKAGMKWGAEIISLDGKPTDEVVSATVPWSSPFSAPAPKRLQQLRYALRFKTTKLAVETVFKNPGGEEQSASLLVVEERASFSASSFSAGITGTELPVEFKILPSGLGYIKISSFFDNDVLTIQVWERALKLFIDNDIKGIVLDLRQNSGGSGWLADQMAAYFFDKETIVGNKAYFDDSTGEFYMDPGDESRMIPPQESLRYFGPVAVMVGPACVSACEFFSYDMTVDDRAIIVGHYPTDGAGGSVEQFVMPEGISGQLTIGRAVDANGDIHIEGKGVAPTVKVPVTFDTLKAEFDGKDVVLEAAEKALAEPRIVDIVPEHPPTLSKDFDLVEALQANGKILEDLAKEKYEDSEASQAGRTYTYTISLPQSRDLIWLYAWCTKTDDQFKDNWGKITLAFTLNGEKVAVDQFKTQDLKGTDGPCRVYYAKLSDWAKGRNVLETIVTFSDALNDGSFDYPAGAHTFEYRVYVQK